MMYKKVVLGALLVASVGTLSYITYVMLKASNTVNKVEMPVNMYIDVGHTPSNVGAISSTCRGEYFYNVDTVNSIINRNTNNIIVSKQGEQTFKDRENMSIGKDLFISIHHDSMNEVWLHKNDKNCLEGNHTKGYSIFVSNRNIAYDKSIDYAKQISKYLLDHGGVVNISHAKPSPDGSDRELIDAELGIYNYPNLIVLRKAHSPAILIEVSVITNPIDDNNASIIRMDRLISSAINNLKKER